MMNRRTEAAFMTQSACHRFVGLAAACGGLLLTFHAAEEEAFCHMCHPPQYREFLQLNSDGGNWVVQKGRPARIHYGLDRLVECRTRSIPVAADAELGLAKSKQGPWTRLARGRGRLLAWTPQKLGVWWLRVKVKDPDKEAHTLTRAVFVGDGEVKIPRTRYAPFRAELWAEGGPAFVSVSLYRKGRWTRGPLSLPRGPGWWLLNACPWRLPTDRCHRYYWAQVTSDGSVKVNLAPAWLRIRISDLPSGWRMWIRHPAAPYVPVDCRNECFLRPLPAGRVELMVQPIVRGQPARSVFLDLKARNENRITLSAMHLLASVPQPVSREWGFFEAPTLRGPARRDSCRLAVPFDGPDGEAALGRAVCARPARGKGAKRRGRWIPRIERPGYFVHGRPTRPVVHGRRIVWAETTFDHVQHKVRLGRMFAFYAAGGGMAAERIPLDSWSNAAAVAVGPGGDLFVVGQTGYHEPRGFLAVRRRKGWQIFKRQSKVTAVLALARKVIAIDGEGLFTCDRRCTAGPRHPLTDPFVALLAGTRGPLVVTRSGAVYSIRSNRQRLRLRLEVARPSFGIDLGQVAAGSKDVFGLFGPLIRGSEYHPFCVGSVVASLEAKGWRVVHRVAGKGGRRLDCQDDDARNAVVVSIAVAKNTVYARRRARLASLRGGFEPLCRIPRKDKR